MTEFSYVKTKREDVKPIPEKNFGTIKKFMKYITTANVWVYKKSKGKLWSNFPGGYPIMILGSRGAKSGEWREVALIHVPINEDGVDKEFLVASQGGMSRHPLWYHNVKANPEIEITHKGTTRKMVARQISEEEKAKYWPHLLSYYPDYDEYQARTDRPIPVFLCEPV